MDHEFWHERWRSNRIGFHEARPNPLLVEHLPSLQLESGARIFLPLCGKSLDIHWLLEQGFEVVGCELSADAIRQLFDELGVTPQVEPAGKLEIWRGPGLTIFVGDFFALTGAVLGPVDAIYDRAALVALPQDMRQRYALHLTEVSVAARQLLISFDYDQAQMQGPPFSVAGKEVLRLYDVAYAVEQLADNEIPGGFRQTIPARETVWRLEAISAL